MNRVLLVMVSLCLLAGSCKSPIEPDVKGYLLAGENFGVAYSGFREGQHPDRGAGARNPSREQVAEDLRILVDHGFRLIRLYDSGENSALVLDIIRVQQLPLKVLLGVWLEAEISNHENCPWLDEPIPASVLLANREANRAEVSRAVQLAKSYPESVAALNVGNEALVEWTDHLVPLDSLIDYVRTVKAAVALPVTVAENYEWWAAHGAALAAELDFIGVHTYPQWEGRDIDRALAYTEENLAQVRRALPGVPMAVLEAGWASLAEEFGDRAGEPEQQRHYRELRALAEREAMTVLFFEAFDEPWKGHPDKPLAAEKHWGLFTVGRTAKQAMQGQALPLYDSAAVVWAVNLGGEAYIDVEGVAFEGDTLEGDTVRGLVDRVKGAQDTGVYGSYREGALELAKSLPNGIYDLALYFVEPANTAMGDRVFDVRIQGAVAIPALDVRQARDGMSGSALLRTVHSIMVEDGQFRLSLDSRKGEPVLSAFALRARRPDDRKWDLVWSDEFDYQGRPDPKKWNIDSWEPRRVNDEDQAYTVREKNLRVENSLLMIEAHRELYGEAQYTSGRVHSLGKGDWLYGRVDIRARLPGGQGTWPALWMLPSDAFRYATLCSDDPADWQGSNECDAWPNSGEIDIMEHVGYDMRRLHGTVHNRAYYHVNREQRKGSMEVDGLERDFHVYSLEWTSDVIRVFFDGIPYFTYVNEGDGWESWPYDHPYHLIMNLAVGGHWGRAGGPIDDSVFPVRLEVDYVRVFEPAR